MIYKLSRDRCLIYIIFKEADEYYSLVDISLFPTLIWLTDILGGKQHFVAVVGK